MNFLFPLYLLGIAAVAVPIILHLRRRPPKDRMEFSSLMLLSASPMQRKKKRKLDNLLLLLLRCALICLLAFLFGRPFFRGGILAEGGKEGKWMVVLLDRSASMQREDLWDRAIAKVKAHAREAGLSDRIALVLFDRREDVRAGFDRWKETPASDRVALWEEALAEAKPGWGETRLAQALAFALELLEEEKQSETGETAAIPEETGVILISDLQEGSDIAELDATAWPEGVALLLDPVEAASENNASLHLLASENVLSLVEGEDEVAAAGEEERENGPRVRVFNQRASAREEFTVAWEGGGAKTDVSLAAGMQSTLRFSSPDPGARESPVLALQGDDHDFDNRIYVTDEARRPLRVVYFGSSETRADDTSQPLFYLQRAIQATNLHEPWVSNEIPEDLNLAETADLVVIAGAVEDERLATIRDYLDGGGSALFLLRTAEQGRNLGQLLGAAALPVEEAELGAEYVLLDDIDFENPMLAAFADPRVRDFSKIHVWKYRRLAANQEWPEGGAVAARFESGDAAWMNYPIGAGRLVIFTSSWHPADSQLALSTKFVPLLYSILERGGEDAARRQAQFVVGDPLPVGQGAVVRRPGGATSVAEEGSAFYRGTDLPGVYVSSRGAEELSFAVNLAPSESRTLPMAESRFEEAGIVLKRRGGDSPDAAAVENDKAREQHLLDVEKEKRQQVWRWLVLAAIGVLFFEMALGGRSGERPQPVPDEAVS